MLSPRVLVRGNPARAKFAAENCFFLWFMYTAVHCCEICCKDYSCTGLWPYREINILLLLHCCNDGDKDDDDEDEHRDRGREAGAGEGGGKEE